MTYSCSPQPSRRYGGYRAGARIGDVEKLAVRGKCNPLRHGTGGSVVGRIDVGERAVPDQLQLGQRILKDRVSNRAADPKRLSVGRDADAVRGSVQALFAGAIPAGPIRKLDAADFGMLGKIHDRKSVEVGKLDKDAAGGAVEIGVESHRAYTVVEFDLPGDLVGLEIDDRS